MRNGKYDFQETRQVLQRFGTSIEKARNKYREFLAAGISTEETDDLLQTIRENNAGIRDRNYSGLWVVGDVPFQKQVHAKAQNNRITLARYKREGISLDGLLKALAMKMKIDDTLMLFPSKKTVYADARKIFCYFACTAGFPTLDIGNFLLIQQAAVSHAARKGALLAKKLSITIEGKDSIV